jgi:hypothetical protein
VKGDCDCACGGRSIRNPHYLDEHDPLYVCERCGRPPSGCGSLCRICGEEIDIGSQCRCGYQAERLQISVSMLMLNNKRAEFKLEEAAVRLLKGDKSADSIAGLKRALTAWLDERGIAV